MLHPVATTEDRRPSWGAAAGVAAFAAGVRLAVLGLTLLLAPAPTGAGDLARLHDGREYLAIAASIGADKGSAAVGWEAHRLGRGFPLLIRLAAIVLPPPVAALGLAVLGAAAAAALLVRLGVSPAAAAAYCVLTPSWVAFSSTAMSEGPFVAAALLGLLLWRRGDAAGAAGAGVVFAAATAIRPVGAVLFAALWVLGLARGRTRRGGGRTGRAAAAAAVSFTAAGALWLRWSAAAAGAEGQVGTYLRRDLAAPLASLAAGFAAPLADPLKTAQNVVMLALVAAAAVALWGRRREPGGHAPEWLVWLGSQTLFYLLLPSTWVFECLARFLVPALPAVAVALAPLLPRRPPLLGQLLGGLTSVSAGVAVLWTLRALGGG